MRDYSDSEREEALATLIANGGRVRATAAALGIPKPTLISWRNAAIAADETLRSTLIHPDRKRIATVDLYERAGRRAAAMVSRKLDDLDATGQVLTPSGIQSLAIVSGIMAERAMDMSSTLGVGRKSAISIDQSQRLELPAGTTLADLREMAAQLAPPPPQQP